MSDYSTRIGELCTGALALGGEPLLGLVMGALGVAIRHSERIATKQLFLSPAVKREIDASIGRAEALLAATQEGKP